jgi:hypothetical protein
MQDIEYQKGYAIISQLYHEPNDSEWMQGGASMYGGISRESKERATQIFRSATKTIVGASAAIASLGAGGDIVVNAVFAVSSSNAFIGGLIGLVQDVIQAQSLFRNLVTINMNNKIPIESKIKLDDGFTVFEEKFITIFSEHIARYGTGFLDRVYESIMSVIGRIITTISDWIACLFPDTAGLAGEAARSILEAIVKNGYSLIYNLISLLPDNLQQMITNIYALIDYIHQAVAILRSILINLSPKQIAEIITSLGATVSGMVDSGLAKGIIGFTSGTASGLASLGANIYGISSSIGSKFSILPKPEEMMVGIIDKYIVPNIDIGCLLFQKMFPLFLQFTLFIERYKKITGKDITGGELYHRITLIDEQSILSDEDSQETGEKIDT